MGHRWWRLVTRCVGKGRGNFEDPLCRACGLSSFLSRAPRGCPRLALSPHPTPPRYCSCPPPPPQGAERLVLDVRNNGGGLFPAGVEVGRMLLDRGDIVLIADRWGLSLWPVAFGALA